MTANRPTLTHDLSKTDHKEDLPQGKPIIWFHDDIHGNVVQTMILPGDLLTLRKIGP